MCVQPCSIVACTPPRCSVTISDMFEHITRTHFSDVSFMCVRAHSTVLFFLIDCFVFSIATNCLCVHYNMHCLYLAHIQYTYTVSPLLHSQLFFPCMSTAWLSA